MRIAVLNNYDLDHVSRAVDQGDAPDHLLYGINYFRQQGHRVDVIPLSAARGLSSLDRCLRVTRGAFFIGSMRLQVPLLRVINQYDAVYAPCQNETGLLEWLRAIGWITVPLIMVLHHPPKGRFGRLKIRGVSMAPSISPHSARAWGALVGSPSKIPFIPWGPDRHYYPPFTQPGNGVIVSGRSHRDWKTMAAAARRMAVPVSYFTSEPAVEQLWARMAPAAHGVELQAKGWSFRDVVPHIAQACAVAIPLSRTDNLGGLTSLVDALSMGRPVIMTRNPFVYPDIEKEGVGIWVNPGDVEGWIRACEYLHANPGVCIEMGLRGRALVENGLNSENFARAVLRHIESAVR